MGVGILDLELYLDFEIFVVKVCQHSESSLHALLACRALEAYALQRLKFQLCVIIS